MKRLDSHQPLVEIVCATSIDGKIADFTRAPTRIASKRDRLFLHDRLRVSDATMFGAGTLRALQSGLYLEADPKNELTQIVVSRRNSFDRNMPFFREGNSQRWLVTSEPPSNETKSLFDEVFFTVTPENGQIDWVGVLAQMRSRGVQRICCGGGGELSASLIQQNVVDEIRLTIAPLVIGGRLAPTLTDGDNNTLAESRRFELVNCNSVDGEIFAHYRRA